MQEQYSVGIYARLSRDDERAGESVSIENQKEMLARYVREQGWTCLLYTSISSEQLAYVTNSEPGHGLLFFNNVILPFADDFPKDTELYKLLTTKPVSYTHLDVYKRQPFSCPKRHRKSYGAFYFPSSTRKLY